MLILLFFFFNDTATTEIYTLSLHDALPISLLRVWEDDVLSGRSAGGHPGVVGDGTGVPDQPALRMCDQKARHGHFCRGEFRSEEHTSELQSPCNLVCRLLLEKKKKHT